MLGRLMKYDFKALNRYLIVIHIMLLVTALLGRLLLIGRLVNQPDTLSDSGIVIVSIGIFLYVILFMTAVFGTLLLIAIHFYKNLYSDEGYLTHTLPVSRSQLLISKTITGSVWMLIDMVLVIASVLILVLHKPVIREFSMYKDEMLGEMGFPASVGYGKILLLLFILLVVTVVGNVLTIYVSIAVGQLFSNHRVLGAVVAYFSISTVIGIISGVIGAVYSLSVVINGADESFLYQYYTQIYLISLILGLVTAAGFYVITQLLMQKKLNLS